MFEGIVKKYIICGPFPYKNIIADGYESFYIDYLEELEGEENAILRPGMTVGGAKCIEYEADESGVVDFVKLYGEEFADFWRLRYGVAYLYTELEADERDYVLLIGSEDYVSLYINGSKIFSSNVSRRFTHDFYAVPIRLHKGLNRFLFKVSRYAGRWMFSARLVEVDKPIYIHRSRVLKPNAVRGAINELYISIPILAMREIKGVRVECVENDLWNGCSSEISMLREGEEIPIPLYITSKKPIDSHGDHIYIDLNFYVDGEKIDSLRLELKVVDLEAHRVESYRSSSDGSVHLYGLKPPKGYSKDRAYPLIISLHGFKGHPFFSELYGEKDWCFIASPTARDGEVPYREIGLVEVLELIDLLTKRYNIDPNRIYLTGHSMGGYGTWFIGVRFPHLFAAVAPLSSRGDLSEMIDTLRKRPGWEGIADLMSHYNPADFVENLSSTPIYISHGDRDRIVPVDASRRMASRLKDLGYKYIYEEVDGADHVWGDIKPGERYGLDCIDRESIEGFFIERRRAVPKKIIAKTDSDRFSRIWWVEVLKEPDKRYAYVELEIKDNALHIVRAADVESIVVDIDMLRKSGYIVSDHMEIIYGERSVKIDIDKREYIKVLLGNDLCVDLVEHMLCSNNISKIYVDRDVRIRKRKPVTGPFMDLFNNRFAIIACSKDPSCSYAALYIQRWWFNYSNGYTRIFSDRDAVERNLHREYNLLAIGGPEMNIFVDKIHNMVKIFRFVGDCEIMLRGERHKADKIGIAIIYPNPLNMNKYIGILGGNSPESINAIERLPLTMVPDYLVYDAKLLGKDPRGIIASGFFNDYWE